MQSRPSASSPDEWAVIPEGRLDASAAPELEQRQTRLDVGDVLILYTDGVTEPINAHEEEFGEERLVQAVAEVSHRPSTEMVECIRAAVARFVGDQPQFDDYNLVAVKRKK